MKGILLSLFGLCTTALGQKITAVVANGAPYPVVDGDGNARGFNPQQAVIFDASAPGLRPSALVLEQIASGAIFQINIQDIPGPGTITASIDGQNVLAPIQVSNGGSGTVQAQFDQSRMVKGAPWQLSRTIVWAFNGQAFDQTPVEIYAVSSTLPIFFQKYGIYRDLLQWLLPQNDGTGRVPQDTDSYHAYVVQKVHFESGHVYDTFRGASAYAMYGNLRDPANILEGTFSLRRWLNDRANMASFGAGATLNCYDQASMVQICLSLGLTPMELLNVAYLRPFGYIKPTSLVGFRGVQVNSPFFKGQIELASVPEEDPQRTAFDNHMFAVIGQPQSKDSLRACDACAGPAQCDASLQQYMDNAIDPDNAAGAQEPPADYVRIGRGIQDFDTFNIQPSSSFRVKRGGLDAITDLQKRLTSMGAKNTNAGSGTTNNVYRPDFNQLGANLRHKVLHSDSVLGHDAAVFDYLYRLNEDASGKQDVRIRVTVTSDYDSAFLAMVHSVAQMSTKLEDFWQGPTNNNERFGAWTIDSKPANMQGAILFVDGNVLVDISGLQASQDLQRTAQAIHNFITNPPSQARPEAPSIGTFQNTVSVKVGQTQTLSIDVDNYFKGYTRLKHGNALVTYMKHDGNGKLEIDIVGVRTGREEILLVVSNSAGESVRKPLRVNIA